jgi:hypothetical protein
MKSRRTRWARMGEKRNVHRLLAAKLGGEETTRKTKI